MSAKFYPRLFSVFQKSLVLVPVCLSCDKEVATRPSALARYMSAWEFGGITASPLAASPHARRSWEISATGCGYPKPAGWLSSSRVALPQPAFRGSAVCMFCCAHRNILTYLVGHVHGDLSGAGGSSCSGRGGHFQPPASLVVEVEAVAEGTL